MEDSNQIHPSAMIGPLVTMGKGNIVGPYAVILGKTALGDNNVIRSHAVIGSPAEKHGFMGGSGEGVSIGNACHISEFTTVHAGTQMPTVLGDRVILLRGAHVGHDSLVGDGVTVSCGAIIGGHSIIGRGANLGLASVLHQFSRIGAWAMLGMSTVVPKKKRIVPGTIYIGSPARFLKNNTIALQRQGVLQSDLQLEIQKYYALTSEWKN